MWKFYSDGSVNGWGWRFTVYPIMPSSTALELLSDRALLSKPSVEPVTCILSNRVGCYTDKSLVARLAAALAACAQLSSLGIYLLLCGVLCTNFKMSLVFHLPYFMYIARLRNFESRSTKEKIYPKYMVSMHFVSSCLKNINPIKCRYVTVFSCAWT